MPQALGHAARSILAPKDVAALTLQAHGLPAGILPLDEVCAFELRPDGHVSVRLAHAMRRTVECPDSRVALRYSEQISGHIEHGRLTGVRGICTRPRGPLPLLWTTVDTLQRTEETELHLTVGARRGHDIPVAAFSSSSAAGAA